MRVYIGIDWSERKHDVVFINEAGAAVVRLTVPHTPEGFLQIEATRQKLGMAQEDCLIGLETAHNLVVDSLWSQGYSNVYVIPPGVVKSVRGRYGQSGARTDQGDAFLLADLLRTDRARLQPWHPDSLPTRQMRAKVSLILHLTRTVVRLSNRLRAILLRYYPAALNVFSHLRTQVALKFIQAYPTPQAAASPTLAEFEAFARRSGYRRLDRLPACFARLQAPQPEPAPETVAVYQEEAPLLAALLLETIQAKKSTQRALKKRLEQHPDHSRHQAEKTPFGSGIAVRLSAESAVDKTCP
ncbi:MAG TPA: IS110 family transposase [Anaerolineales bacterium]|nr:IS110 family transposase [Anaerolineales bacterium]